MCFEVNTKIEVYKYALADTIIRLAVEKGVPKRVINGCDITTEKCYTCTFVSTLPVELYQYETFTFVLGVICSFKLI